MGHDQIDQTRASELPDVVIRVIDAIESSINRSGGMLIQPCITYSASYWKPGKFHKTEVTYDKNLFTYTKGDEWRFLTGLIPRIQQFCRDQNLTIQVDREADMEPDFTTTYDAGEYTMRPDQYQLVEKIAELKRGVIKAPTGTGKTICQLGVFEWFYDTPILILAHNANIVIQTAEKFKAQGFEVQQIGGGKQFSGHLIEDGIVVSTRQSFIKIDPRLYADHFGVVMIDETHHVSAEDGQYAKILRNLLAPIRIGFTATTEDEETKPQAVLACEGLLGPIIGETTMEEAQSLGILAKPRVKLLRSPNSSKIRRLSKYPEIYQKGIVENYDRNRLIMDSVAEHVAAGDTVLIFVKKVQHSDRLMNMAKGYKILEDVTRIVRGSVSAQAREEARQLLETKTIKCVISTVVWQEGIDVRSLDVIWNAGAGKDDKDTLQKVGRGLRKTDGKEEVLVYDIFDQSHVILIRHFGFRITKYMENNWL